MAEIDWIAGDYLGLQIPAHGEALREGGETFLTAAFRATGALSPDNSVVRITQLEECPGGSTGRKQFLTVEYARPEPGLHTDLFVKYSRDFDDALRDRGKNQLEDEVRFGLFSREPGFPIAVPACQFADYHHESGTGLLITQRIGFGRDGIEPIYEKCLDYEVEDAIGHYRALIKTLARLSGTHKGGGLSGNVESQFPFDAQKAANSDPIRYTVEKLQNRVSRYADFAARYPRILPANIREPAFIEKLRAEVARFPAHEKAIKRYLASRPDLIALCHWNANIDNAWFWRDEEGTIQCGLIDWGRVGQMSVAAALWGCLSAAEKEMWDDHLDELLALFVAEFAACGGPALDPEEVKTHMMLFIVMLGLSWLMDAPPLIQSSVPDLEDAESPWDPRFKKTELGRAQLHMFTNFLNLWQTQDFGAILDRFLAEGHGD